MSMTEITVCTTCRRSGTQREMPADGMVLFLAVQAALDASAFDTDCEARIRLRGQACMSGCSRACTVSLQATGKHAYYFGDLMADDESAEQVLACARLHQATADGNLPRNDRPARLRPGIIARLPPVSIAEGPRAVTSPVD